MHHPTDRIPAEFNEGIFVLNKDTQSSNMESSDVWSWWNQDLTVSLLSYFPKIIQTCTVTKYK